MKLSTRLLLAVPVPSEDAQTFNCTIYFAYFLTLYPEDLKWHPLLVNVLFILTQNARSIPRYNAPLAASVICADTVDKAQILQSDSSKHFMNDHSTQP